MRCRAAIEGEAPYLVAGEPVCSQACASAEPEPQDDEFDEGGESFDVAGAIRRSQEIIEEALVARAERIAEDMTYDVRAR